MIDNRGIVAVDMKCCEHRRGAEVAVPRRRRELGGLDHPLRERPALPRVARYQVPEQHRVERGCRRVQVFRLARQIAGAFHFFEPARVAGHEERQPERAARLPFTVTGLDGQFDDALAERDRGGRIPVDPREQANLDREQLDELGRRRVAGECPPTLYRRPGLRDARFDPVRGREHHFTAKPLIRIGEVARLEHRDRVSIGAGALQCFRSFEAKRRVVGLAALDRECEEAGARGKGRGVVGGAPGHGRSSCIARLGEVARA